jgi:hypothetical protein
MTHFPALWKCQDMAYRLFLRELGRNQDGPRGGGADLTKIQPAGIRTKSGGARSIEGGKGPAGSGLSLGKRFVSNREACAAGSSASRVSTRSLEDLR